MSRRGNGFGTLVNKGEGRPWLAKWMFDGKVFTKSTGQVDKKKALKVLEVLTRPFREKRAEDVLANLELKMKQIASGATKEPIEVKSLWDEFSKKRWDGDIAESTAKLYRSYLEHLVSWLDANHIKLAGKVKKSDAEKFLVSLSKDVCANAFNNMLVFYKRVWKTLADEYGLDARIWDDFKKLKAEKTSRRALKPEEIWNMTEKAGADKWMMILIALGIYTGLRIGDCACMKWENVDFTRKVISIVPMKTKRHMNGPIEIPMHDALAKVLRDAWKDGEEYVCEENYKLYKSGKLCWHVKELFKKCGIETKAKVNGKVKLVAGFHSLRHTFVSMAINGGMSPMLVQRIVGHSSVDMTAAYFHSNETAMRKGIEELPDFLD